MGYYNYYNYIVEIDEYNESDTHEGYFVCYDRNHDRITVEADDALSAAQEALEIANEKFESDNGSFLVVARVYEQIGIKHFREANKEYLRRIEEREAQR